MESFYDQGLDSPSKNSYIGSYYKPPDRMLSASSRQLEFPETIIVNPQNKSTADSRAVVDALKTLQEKIKKLEVERKRAEMSYKQFSLDAQKHQEVSAARTVLGRPAASLPETDNSARKMLDSQLKSAEARCKVLEKQLDYMRKMVESANKERNVLMQSQASLQNKPTSSTNSQTQRDKLEKLESECLKLSKTQTLAEMKLAILEQKLLQEENERKLVQEKAEELQREFDVSLRLSAPNAEETQPNKKTKKTKKTSNSPRCNTMPFVAGTSTSPSHSVHANVQSILHMMKHHQPQLCERVGSLHRPTVKKNLHKNVPQSTGVVQKPADPTLSSLSDLLLALQDELGQMSFEHQELARRISAAGAGEGRQDLRKEMETLVIRMEKKGAQITKLRKHQQTLHQLTRDQQGAEEKGDEKAPGRIKPPSPSPVTAKQTGMKGTTTQTNLRLLRDTQKLRNSLKQDDLSWET